MKNDLSSRAVQCGAVLASATDVVRQFVCLTVRQKRRAAPRRAAPTKRLLFGQRFSFHSLTAAVVAELNPSRPAGRTGGRQPTLLAREHLSPHA